MPEDNKFSSQPWSPQEPAKPPQPSGQSLPTGEGESPLTTPKDIKFDLRTMSSDIASMKESGGGAPRPYVPPPPIRPREDAIPPAGIAFAPEKINPIPTSPVQPKIVEKLNAVEKPKKSGKGLFYSLIILIVVLGLGALGYFVIYPNFFGDNNAPQPEQQEVVNNQPPVEVPVFTPPQEEVPEVQSHVSLFKIAADKTLGINLNDPSTLGSLKAGQGESVTTPEVRELIIQDVDGSPAKTDDVLLLFAGEKIKNSLSNFIENDPTVFVYVESARSIPGFALKLRVGASLADAKAAMAEIESSEELRGIFMPLVRQELSWKSGVADGITTRYAVIADGSAINYGWVGDVFVLTGSYNSFKEVARRVR